MIDLSYDDLKSWALRRTETDLRKAAVAAARKMVPQTADLEPPAGEPDALENLIALMTEPGFFDAVISALDETCMALDPGEVDALCGFNPEPSEETRAAMNERIEAMPEQVREGFRKHVKGQSWEDAKAMADKLAAEGKIDDPDRFAGFLYWAGKS